MRNKYFNKMSFSIMAFVLFDSYTCITSTSGKTASSMPVMKADVLKEYLNCFLRKEDKKGVWL